MPDDTSRAELDLLCRRVLASFARLVRETEHQETSDMDDAVLRIDAELAQVRATRERWNRSPVERLRDGFKLTPEEVEFLIACVAVAIHPGFPIDVFPRDDLRRGLSVGLYAMTVPADRAGGAKDLAHRIQRSPIVIAGLLRARADDRNPAWIPWTPSPMLVDFLAGRPLVHARICEVPRLAEEQLVADDAQQRALAEIETTRCHTSRLICVQGAERSGRGTAIASKVICAWSVDLGGLGIEQARTLLLDLRT